MAKRISSDGKGLEKLVSQIYETLKDNPSTKISRNEKIQNKHGGRSEFDVMIRSKSMALNMVTAIECKDYKRKVKVSEIRDFQGKCEEVGGIHRKVFVAVNGYQSGAIGAAKMRDIELYDLSEVSSDLIRGWIDASSIWGTYFDDRQFNVINFYTVDNKVLSYNKADLDPQTPVIWLGSTPVSLNEVIKGSFFDEETTQFCYNLVCEEFRKLPMQGTEKKLIAIVPLPIDVDGEPFVVVLNGRPVGITIIEVMIEYTFTVLRPNDAVVRAYQNRHSERAAEVLSCKIGSMNFEVIRDASSGQTKFFVTDPAGKTYEMREGK